MADPTTISEYATKSRDNAQADVTSAQQQLALAQTNVASKNTALASATSALADLEQQAAAIRQKLSTTQTSADGDALLAELEELTIRARTGEAVVVAAHADLLRAAGDAARAQTDLANVGTQLTKAEAALTQALQAAEHRAARTIVIAGAPFSTLAGDAGDALDETTLPEGANYRAAKARLTTDTASKVADIPAKLFTRAKERRLRARNLITQADADSKAASDALLKEQNDSNGLAGAAQKTWELFQQAETAVEDFVTNAKIRFDQAQANLARVADLDNAPLTAEQTASINAADPLKTLREGAVDTEKARDDKLNAVVLAQAALDAEILKALADGKIPDDVTAVQNKRSALTAAQDDFKAVDDIWRTEEKDRNDKTETVKTRELELAQAIEVAVAAGNDPETDADVATATTNLKNAQIALKAAEDTYDASDHGLLHAWEAAVPDSMWRLVADFEDAEEILTDLKTADPTTLQNQLETAEANYVAAKLAADASAGKLAKLMAEQARREALGEAERQSSPNRRFVALRGDN
jgi:hypothetical protein